MSPARKRLLIGLCVIAGTLAILALYLPGLRPMQQPREIATGKAQIGGAFSLVDSKGNRVTEEILKGHYSLLYFGFTHCPDVCPLALRMMTQVLEIAGPPAEGVIPVFVTVDPERDTPEVVGDYVRNFHPRFVALTGTEDEIQGVTKAYRAYFAKKAGGKPDDYDMMHSDFIYLFDPNGEYVTHFRANDTAVEIANRVRRELMPK